MKLTLARLESGDQGTFGRLVVGDVAFFTGELPWRDNRSNVSCIPAGTYRCMWTLSPRFGRRMYEVLPVPRRAGIRKHSANLMGDSDLGLRCQLNGCIALGERLGWIDRQKAILLSKPAIRRFEAMMGGRPFELVIQGVE